MANLYVLQVTHFSIPPDIITLWTKPSESLLDTGDSGILSFTVNPSVSQGKGKCKLVFYSHGIKANNGHKGKQIQLVLPTLLNIPVMLCLMCHPPSITAVIV
jgi:hypothetical protein